MSRSTPELRSRFLHLSALCGSVLVSAVACGSGQRANAGGDVIYVWSAATDTARGSFLAVFDIGPGRPAEARLVSLVPAPTPSRGAHHTEHEVGKDHRLFANAFGSAATYLFDLRAPNKPRIIKTLGAVGPFSHPHSFARLPNGNTVATFQVKIGGALPGGLVEFDLDGNPTRWASASSGDADSVQIVPYSVVALPELDRLVSTSTHMTEDIGVHVQIWRLSDLRVLHTLKVPLAPSSGGHGLHEADRHRLPGEPRVLADGRTVMFGTFTCGLYHLSGLTTESPAVEFSAAFPGENCAVPVVVGKYWIQTVPELHALIALDVSNPSRPVEVSRAVFADTIRPHWVAVNASGTRLAMTSGRRADPTVHVIGFEPNNGSFKRGASDVVLSLRNVQWPDGYVGDAIPHGIVFRR